MIQIGPTPDVRVPPPRWRRPLWPGLLAGAVICYGFGYSLWIINDVTGGVHWQAMGYGSRGAFMPGLLMLVLAAMDIIAGEG